MSSFLFLFDGSIAGKGGRIRGRILSPWRDVTLSRSNFNRNGWRWLTVIKSRGRDLPSKPRVVGCWIGAREINKISIRSLYDTFSRTSLGHQRKIVIGSLKNVRSALYADYGMLCQECFQRVRWRVRDAYKCRLRRASECAGRRRTSRYTRVSNHRADIWQGRKGSLSLSLSRRFN